MSENTPAPATGRAPWSGLSRRSCLLIIPVVGGVLLLAIALALIVFLGLQSDLFKTDTNPGMPVEVIRPDGSREKLEIARDRPRLYAATEKPGFYRVRGPEGKDALFACAVLDEAESSNAARERLIFAERGVRGESWQLGDVSGKGSKSGREVWKYLALIALGVMVLEWYVYNRKVQI